MGKSNVKVVVRARPTAVFADSNFAFNEQSDSIDMFCGKSEGAGIVNNQQETWHFKLDKVLRDVSQESVFSYCAMDVIHSVMEGYNGTIMAYGQTGAGKTFTMTGGNTHFLERGIIPRAIHEIYSQVAERPENIMTIRLSYCEIYNELMFDLLTDRGISEQSGDLAIVEDAKGCIKVRGLIEKVASTEEEALHIFFEGDTNRAVAEHALNKASTRSHVVFTLHVESRSRVESSEKIIHSKLHLVDLAGSERVKKSGSEGVTLKEATYINKSLTFLEQFVLALGDRHRDHKPYRQSKLTHLLKDSLGGNCKTVMVANIWPESSHLEETASTLRFATRMMRVINEPTINVHLDDKMLLKKYEREIKDLKQELAMHDTLAGRSRVQYEDYTPDEQRELEVQVKSYLEGDTPQLEVVSLRMVVEAFTIFRKLHQGLQKDLAERPRMAQEAGAEGEAGGVGPSSSPQPEVQGADQFDDEEGKGFSVGDAPLGSRPAAEDGMPVPVEGDEDHRVAADQTQLQGEAAEKAPDKQSAFSEWKGREGKPLEEDFEANRQQLKDQKTLLKDTMQVVNTKKKEIDEAKERVARKQAEKDQTGDADTDVVDEEYFALIRNLKELKQAYRETFEKHKEVKREVMQIEHNMQMCKQNLVASFEEYYDQKYKHLQKDKDIDENRAGEAYDSQEQFDLLEADRLEQQHPDALAFYKAKKTATRNTRQKPPGVQAMRAAARGR
jgi:kinesin family protein 6/9